MLNHTGALWQYLGSFVLYTLGAVALIYGAYWYARRSTGGLISGASKQSDPQVPALEVETTLALDPRKTLYVIRSGQERFLLAASGDDTQLLSRLESVAVKQPADVEIPIVEETPRLEPWYAIPQPSRPAAQQAETFGSRFVKSVQWLVASRMK